MVDLVATKRWCIITTQVDDRRVFPPGEAAEV